MNNPLQSGPDVRERTERPFKGGAADPGLTILAGDIPVPPWLAVERHGGVAIHLAGPLASRHATETHILWVDGLLFDADAGGRTAETLLQRFLSHGEEGLTAANGSFNAALLDRAGCRLLLVQDALATRPWYRHAQGRTLVVAPSPMLFAALGRPMTLNRVALYETLRLLHPVSPHTLASEVTRTRPGYALHIRPDGRWDERSAFRWVYDPTVLGEQARDLDAQAAEIKESVAEAIRGVLVHPACRHRPRELGLTGGLDSRHILGELLEQGDPPARLRHVGIKQGELAAVRAIAAGLGLPLLVEPVETLDWQALTRRWLLRSGGLVNLHQAYLLAMMGGLGSEGSVGFDGYLMDWLLGLSPKDGPDRTADPVGNVWNRRYTSDWMLGQLLPDSARLRRPGPQWLATERDRFHGPAWFQSMMLDIHHRGLCYTGAAMAMTAPEALLFAPGASRRALLFCLRHDAAIGGDKRARLHALNRSFPALARYPDPNGVPYAGRSTVRKAPVSLGAYLRPWVRAVFSGGRRDPAPETEHAWFRHIPVLRGLAEHLTADSRLARDGHIRAVGLERCWRLHRLGGYEGWTLFSLLSAEAAYRCLIRRESPDTLLTDWFGP